jgi:transposase
MLICGIDIAKNKHEASLVDESGKLLSKSLRFSNDNSGAASLLEYLSKLNPDGQDIIFGMEATGHYWLALYSFLFDKGFTVHVINPIQTDALRNVFIRKTKNDSKDSYLIAETVRMGYTSSTLLPDDALLGLRQLCRHRTDLVDMTSELKCKIIGLLDRIFPEYAKLFSDTFGKSSVELLSRHTTPEEIAELSSKKLATLLGKCSRGRFGIEKAEQIKAAAKNSFGIRLGADIFALQIRQLLDQIMLIEDQISVIEAEMETRLSSLNSCITTIPGIGPVLGAAIVSEIGDISAFTSAEKLVAFAGIDPSVVQSGNFEGTRGKMSKRGSPHLRRALWLAAQRAANLDGSIFRTFYLKKISEGKHHYTAIGAVARKLSYTVFAVLRDNKPYVPIA